MEPRLFRNDIIIKKSEIHGFGVFAARHIEKGDVIEECPVLLTPVSADSILRDYVFYWEDEIFAIALGYGSLYNHSSQPNAVFERDKDFNVLVIRAGHAILPDEEIFIHYGNDWFTQRKKTANEFKELKRSSVRSQT